MHQEVITTTQDIPNIEDPFSDTEQASSGAEPDAPQHNPMDAETEPTPKTPDEETMTAIRTLLKQSNDTQAELSETRTLFEKIFERDRDAKNRASEDEFIKQAREHYQSDPFQGAAMLVGKARDDLARLMDEKIYEAFGAREQFSRLMDDFLEEPAHTTLRGFRDELEFLIRDRGVEPKDAANFLKSVELKARKAAGRKNEALREARTRATTESGGSSLATPDQDRELTRALTQAKNLDEMFTALKRAKG